MFIIGINIGIVLLLSLVIFSLFAKKSFSLGRWYERGIQPYKYWETIIAYLIILCALWFGRNALLAAI